MNKEQCINIWRNVLAKENIKSDKNFFENGGDSIKVLELAKIIQEKYEIELDIMDFFNDATIGNVLHQVNKTNEIKMNSNLSQLRKGKDSTKNLLFIHGGSGEIGAFLRMCNAIDDSYNIYAISFDKSRMELHPQIISVEELADLYLTYLSDANITSINAIVGWCIGGKIAFEMADKLDDSTINLYLLNAVPPNQSRKNIKNSSFTIDEERAFLRRGLIPYKVDKNFIQTTPELWEDFTEYMKKHKVIYKYLKSASPKYLKNILKNNNDIEVFVKYLNLIRSFEEAHYTYQKSPEKKIRRIYYVNAIKKSVDNFQYWENYTQEYIEFNIESDHDGIVSEEVANVLFKELTT
ncbi:thioesterase domain-containing protein [Peribacillus butanolivorans]|uniref:thioesterase domain-containing protein n=1 Tax=Peribacillus butanolivorans TaxID=421767 RepID=UPI0036DB54EF